MCQCLHIIEICIYTTACVSNTIVFLFLFWFLTKNKLNFTTCSLFSFRGQKKRRLISPHPPHVYYEGAFLAKTSKGKKENKSTKISLKDRNSDGARENALRRSRVTRVTYRKGRALWAHTFLWCKGIESCPHPFLLPLPRACAAHRHTIIIIEERRRRRRHHRRSCLPKVVLFVLPLLLPLARAPLATAR